MRCISQRTKTDGTTFPCGKCGPCLSRKRNDWSLRLEEEVKVSSSAYFVTLTYADEYMPRNINGSPTVCKRDCQLFLKRLRKAVSRIDPNIRIRYYLVAEYGSNTLRPHYHAIIFNLPVLSHYSAQNLIIESWKSGLVHVGSCTPASIAYCTKYCINRHNLPSHGGDKTFSLMSRNPGLGSSFLAAQHDSYMDFPRPYVVRPGGYKAPLPRYYSDRFFSSSDKELLKHDSTMLQIRDLFDNETKYFLLNPDHNIIDYGVYCLSRQEEMNNRIIDKSLKMDKL